MKILHFTGEGHGLMARVDEYVVVIEDDDDVKEQFAPGFTLASETDIPDLPAMFPINTILIRG